jgi:glycosyltransferase involved in cell wall biosynthesis
MIPVKYVGALFDASGYASAARGYCACLLATRQVDLTCEAVSFEAQKTTHGQVGEMIKPLLDKPLPHRIQIVHLTPDNFPRFVRSDKYNIGYCAWETDLLPENWPTYCNQMDELWVPSDYNVEVFKKSGVTKPVYKILHGIEEPVTTGIAPMEIGSPDVFTFYSIFQWIERKNPICLLKAYLTEFSSYEQVNLAIKSYRLNTSIEEQEVIKKHVRAIKSALNLPAFPPITFFGGLFPRQEMIALHLRGDCFVLPCRSEGFGITQAEAMAYGKPTISTNYSGMLEFMNEKNSFLVDCSITPVYGMLFPNYNAHMNWSEPNVMSLRKQMRWVFEHRKEANLIGEQGKRDVLSRLSWSKIGEVMLERLTAIEAGLKGKK